MLLLVLLRVGLVHNVKVRQQVHQDDLDLRTGEEPAQARPQPVPKVDVAQPSRGMLELELLAGLVPQSGEAQGVKLSQVRVDSRILINSIAVDSHAHPSGYDIAR